MKFSRFASLYFCFLVFMFYSCFSISEFDFEYYIFYRVVKKALRMKRKKPAVHDVKECVHVNGYRGGMWDSSQSSSALRLLFSVINSSWSLTLLICAPSNFPKHSSSSKFLMQKAINLAWCLSLMFWSISLHISCSTCVSRITPTILQDIFFTISS